MFERYTETARRAIFFARYEASQFGSPYIETEHLLLGVLREDKALANRLLASRARADEIRDVITSRSSPRIKVSTSVDLPLTHESKRVLAYAAEESQRRNHKHIDAAHLLLGLLREEKCFAAELLRDHGVTVALVREQVSSTAEPLAHGRSASIVRLTRWLAACKEDGGWTVEQRPAGNRANHFAFYAPGQAKESGEAPDVAAAKELAQIQKRIDLIMERLEHAIASHEFAKARVYSDEERKERENLRALCEQFNLESPPSRVPLLCIAVIGDDLFSALRQQCEAYLAEGVGEVWLLDPGLKRSYTITKADGLREFKGEILRFADPRLEMDLARIFN